MNFVCVAAGDTHTCLAQDLRATLSALGVRLRVLAPVEHWATAKLRVLADASEPTVLLDADLIVRRWPPFEAWSKPRMAVAYYAAQPWGNTGLVYTPGASHQQAFAALLDERLIPPYWDELAVNRGRAKLEFDLLPIEWCDTRTTWGDDSYIWHPCGPNRKGKHNGTAQIIP